MHLRLPYVLVVIAACSITAAEPVMLIVQMPGTVQFLGSQRTERTVEVTLSASALSAGVLLPPGAAVRLVNQNCVVSLAAPNDQALAVRVLSATSGAVTITMGRGAMGAPAGLSPAPEPLANSAPSESGAAGATIMRVPPPGRLAGIVPPTIESSSPSGIGSASDAQPPAITGVAPVAKGPALAELPAVIAQIFQDAKAVGFDPVAKSDYALPPATAAAAIGSTSSLVRAAAPREVVTSLLSDFDKDGKLQVGFSLAGTPYTWLRKRPLDSDEYQNDAMKRFWANFQVSVAGKIDDRIVTAGSKAARFGTGVSMVFFDDGDLRRDNTVLAAMGKALTRVVPQSITEDPNALMPPIPEAQIQRARAVWNAAKAKNWNAASAGMGVAPAFLSLTGKIEDARDDGVMAWASFSAPGPGALADSVQVLLGGNARLRQRVITNGVGTRTDTIDAGGQIRYGAEGYHFFAEGQYRRRSPQVGAGTEKLVYELGLEHRVAQGVWLNLSWTNDDAVTGGKTIRSGLRYGFGDKAVLAVPKN